MAALLGPWAVGGEAEGTGGAGGEFERISTFVVCQNTSCDTDVDRPREPDAVAWLDPLRLATANEGDLFGGTRGFTVFGASGRTLFDAGTHYDSLAQSHGHYPEDRSENKGTEPEGVLAARFAGRDLLFVGSERGNFVAV